LDLKASLNATLIVVVVVVVVVAAAAVVVVSSLKTPKAFLMRSATKLCVLILPHILYRSAISDFKNT